MPAVVDAPGAPKRSVLKLSMAVSTAIAVAVLAGILLFDVSAADAGTWTMTASSTGTFNWSNPSGPPSFTGMWNPPVGNPAGCNYPGQAPCPSGDTVQLNGLTGSTVIVDVALPQPLTLSVASTSFALQVPAAGAISLTGASTIGNGTTWTISGGTVTNGGTVTSNSGVIVVWTGGTINGPGTFGIANGATLNINGAGPTTLSTQQISNSGSINYAPTNPLAINTGGAISNTAAGSIFLVNDTAINSDGSGSISNAGSITKSGGGATSNINVAVSNTGTIGFSSSATSIALNSGGTHGGTFAFGTGNTFAFNGNHTLIPLRRFLEPAR